MAVGRAEVHSEAEEVVEAVVGAVAADHPVVAAQSSEVTVMTFHPFEEAAGFPLQ